jgi:hypothetical protein
MCAVSISNPDTANLFQTQVIAEQALNQNLDLPNRALLSMFLEAFTKNWKSNC